MEKKKNANVYSTLGASNHSLGERAQFDLYCTHPKAVEELLKLETFSPQIWEPCDGLGHISDTLVAKGYNVRRSDITTRGRDIEQRNFLEMGGGNMWQGDIITNPPYSCAVEMVRKALSVIADDCKVAMWLRILFLESKHRKELFKEFPPKRIWVSSSRIPCSDRNGSFKGSAQGYAWYIWQKGYKGETTINWF